MNHPMRMMPTPPNVLRRCRFVTGGISIAAVLLTLTPSIASADALSDAIRRNEKAEVETLLKAGTEVNATDENHDTPLLLAAYMASPEIVVLLLSKGANLEAGNINGATP